MQGTRKISRSPRQLSKDLMSMH